MSSAEMSSAGAGLSTFAGAGFSVSGTARGCAARRAGASASDAARAEAAKPENREDRAIVCVRQFRGCAAVRCVTS